MHPPTDDLQLNLMLAEYRAAARGQTVRRRRRPARALHRKRQYAAPDCRLQDDHAALRGAQSRAHHRDRIVRYGWEERDGADVPMGDQAFRIEGKAERVRLPAPLSARGSALPMPRSRSILGFRSRQGTYYFQVTADGNETFRASLAAPRARTLPSGMMPGVM